MIHQIWLFAVVILMPPITVVLVPSVASLAPILLVSGFLLLTVVFFGCAFGRSKAGPFALYVFPGKYLRMQFAGRELWWLRFSASIALGGLLGIGALVVAG
jgi:hypothetical protein